MAKVTEITSEPSQSSTSLPPLAENEVELVIDRFWRDTRPRVCVRSETKNVNGFNFRLLVWPQGSKQSQSHLSAFVEVVPPVAITGDNRSVPDGAVSTVYPPDWACPCVFYRISVMNFKQKYPYSKADTWTFSYVCPDRGWHTLLDTRYINRRDGYLSNDGALVIRAIAFPRFAHPISVLPLLNSISHTNASTSSLSSSPSSPRRLGLANILATDHLNSLIQSLFHLPGFRKYIYSLIRKGQHHVTSSPSAASVTDLESISSGIESCIETVQEVMDRISAASPDISRLIQSEFYNECKLNELCTCGSHPTSPLDPLVIRFGRCRALIRCIEETLMSVSASLNRRTVHVLGNKRIQVDAYCQIIRDCGRILSTVANSLFTATADDNLIPRPSRNLVEELQIIFAKLESDVDPSSKSSLIDTRGLVAQLGLCNGGLSSRVSPDGLFVVFFDSLKKCIVSEMDGDDGKFDSLISGSFAADNSVFSHIRVNPTSGKSITSLDKYIAAWMGKNIEDESSGLLAEESAQPVLASVPKILNIQFLNKVKDRLDAPERVSLAQFVKTVGDEEPIVTDDDVIEKQWKNWTEFLGHKCDMVGEKSKSDPISSAYRLHSIMLCSGEVSTGHYSVLVRSNRLCGWTRYDDAWKEDFVDAYDLSFGTQTGSNQSNGTTSSSSSAPPSSPDWVFSPEWSCSSLCYVREDAVAEMYNRGCDVRLIRPDIFSIAMKEAETDLLGSAIACNRFCPEDGGSGSAASSSTIDSTCQVEILLITEKDVLAACPGGFSTPFSFSVPNVSRKLIVRKDIPVERLMKAVHEHFKIPIQLQRLHALRYYPETQQERFELMSPSRPIASHLPPSSFDLASTSSSKSSSRQKNQQNLCSNLYVLVSAVRAGGACRSVFVKIYDEKSLGIVSVGIFNFDPNVCLKEYFEQVSVKATIPTDTPYIVFEEVSARCVELKRTTVAIKDEKILDGDILIFVPLTDSAKRALIGTSLGCSGGVRPKRRLLSSDTVAAPNSGAKPVGPRRLGGHQCECEDCFETCHKDDLLEDETLDERCKRFLERTRNDPSLIDEAYEEMILNELMMAEEDELTSDDDVSSGEEDSSRLRFEAIRRLMKKEPSSTRVADLMSDIMKELEEGGGETVCIRKSSSRRLEIPNELREEISRISAPICFYCQLPIASATVLAEKGIHNIGCRVSCTSRCVGQPMLYHDRCVRDLIRELDNNPLGPDACIITENCSGRVILDAASIKRLESASVAKSLRNANCSASALRSKLGSVLTAPAVPEMVKSGTVRPVIEWKWGPLPTIPSGIKLPKKSSGSKNMKISLPIESLWWNACVEAFGMENLQSAILEKHWDAGDLEKARALFNQWCKLLLEKYHPWRKIQKAISGSKNQVNVSQTPSQLNTPVQSESEESSDSSDEEVVKQEAPIAVPAPVVDVSDNDEDFVLVSNSKGPRRGRSAKQPVSKQLSSPKGQSVDSTDISNSATPTVISIPEGLCGPIAVPEDQQVVTSTAVQPPSILDEIDYLLVDEEDKSEVTSSVVETPVTIDSVLESRMNLLPTFVRQYCLPIELVFVYYSEQFFVSRLIDVGYAKTLALIPPSIESDEEAFLNLITMAAFNNNCAVSRVYVSPVEDTKTSGISVQWFIEFSGVMDCHNFASWVGTTHPEWVPEIGALLPASMLGFAV